MQRILILLAFLSIANHAYSQSSFHTHLCQTGVSENGNPTYGSISHFGHDKDDLSGADHDWLKTCGKTIPIEAPQNTPTPTPTLTPQVTTHEDTTPTQIPQVSTRAPQTPTPTLRAEPDLISEPTPNGSVENDTPVVSNATPAPKLHGNFHITHIRRRDAPYTVYIYVLNASERFVSGITLEIRNADDAVAYKGLITDAHTYFTPGFVNTKRLPDYLSADGVAANNLIAVAPRHVIEAWDYQKETARFRIGVRKFRSVYSEDSVIRLLWRDEVLSEYPEPEVMASPMLTKGKLTTTWADMKRK